MTQRYLLLLSLICGWAALLGYMELQNEVEQIGPRTALVTDHFTGKVQECDTYGNGDWGCHAIYIERRSWVFALIPFWPARDEMGDTLYRSETWADETPFTRSRFFSDLVSNGVIGIVILVMGIIVMRIKDDE